jgi:hypothetical protein
MKPQFKIGHEFIRRDRKRKDIETIEDIYTTTNSKGKVVSIQYVASYSFMGSKVTDYAVPAPTIARSIL